MRNRKKADVITMKPLNIQGKINLISQFPLSNEIAYKRQLLKVIASLSIIMENFTSGVVGKSLFTWRGNIKQEAMSE